jgi:hypothetical protein
MLIWPAIIIALKNKSHDKLANNFPYPTHDLRVETLNLLIEAFGIVRIASAHRSSCILFGIHERRTGRHSGRGPRRRPVISHGRR